MQIALIVAMARNRVIGKDNAMPWHLPEDLKYFKRCTLGKPVIMGRNTFESIGRPLPQRSNIIVSRSPGYRVEGASVVASIDAALALAAEQLRAVDSDKDSDVMIIGGAQIYAQTLPSAQRLYLTEVQAEPEGDAFFPEFERQAWREVAREDHAACDKNPYPYSFVVLERK